MAKNFRQKEETIRFRKNEQIKIKEVRLVGDNVDGGVMPTRDAMRIAEEMDLDLVEINANQNPSICKIMDYSKFLYDEKKKQRELEKKKRENAIKIKEIRLGPNTSNHDLEFKANHAKKFLNDGNKVNVNILFRGREMRFTEQGEATLLKFATMLENEGVVENLPSLKGRKMDMNLKPKNNS